MYYVKIFLNLLNNPIKNNQINLSTKSEVTKQLHQYLRKDFICVRQSIERDPIDIDTGDISTMGRTFD